MFLDLSALSSTTWRSDNAAEDGDQEREAEVDAGKASRAFVFGSDDLLYSLTCRPVTSNTWPFFAVPLFQGHVQSSGVRKCSCSRNSRKITPEKESGKGASRASMLEVVARSVRTEGRTPILRNHRTALVWPEMAARWSGVWPKVFGARKRPSTSSPGRLYRASANEFNADEDEDVVASSAEGTARMWNAELPSASTTACWPCTKERS